MIPIIGLCCKSPVATFLDAKRTNTFLACARSYTLQVFTPETARCLGARSPCGMCDGATTLVI